MGSLSWQVAFRNEGKLCYTRQSQGKFAENQIVLGKKYPFLSSSYDFLQNFVSPTSKGAETGCLLFDYFRFV